MEEWQITARDGWVLGVGDGEEGGYLIAIYGARSGETSLELDREAMRSLRDVLIKELEED
jgi:hypothetical protein